MKIKDVILNEFAPSRGYPGDEGRSFPRKPQKFHAGQVVWIRDGAGSGYENAPAIINYSYEERFGGRYEPHEVYRSDYDNEAHYKYDLESAEYEANKNHDYDVIMMSTEYTGELAWVSENDMTLIPKNTPVESIFTKGNATPYNELPNKIKQKLAAYFDQGQLNEFAPSPGFGDDGPQLQIDQIGGEADRNGKFSYVYSFDIFSSDGEHIGWCEARVSTGKLSGDINGEDFDVSLRDISNPLVTQALSEIHQHQAENTDGELDEAEFNPGRRSFLKKAGAAATAAAMPGGLTGAAIKAVTPTVSALASPFAGLTALDLDDIRHVLKQYHGLHAGSDYEAFTIDEISDLAKDAIRWSNVWFYNKNSAQALLDAFELGKKNGMMEDEILDELKATVGELYKAEMEKLPPKDAAKVRSQSLDNPTVSKQPAQQSAPIGTTGLARAIGNTVQKIGRGTANTILNQPVKDMGKIEPSTKPAALPAPTKPEFEIPTNLKQKTKVAVDRDDKELDRLKEMVKRV